MLRRLVPLLARAAAAAACLFAGPHASAQSAAEREVAELEQQLVQARSELERAEAALEERYARMEEDFLRVCRAPGPIIAELARTLRADAERVRQRLTDNRGGRAPSHAAQVLIAAEELAQAVAATPLDTGFGTPLAQALAEPLLPALLDPQLPDLDARVEAGVTQVLDANQEFAQVWNDHLFRHVVEAAGYAKARERYLDVGQRLEIARSPERFDESGQRLPPGMVQIRAGTYEVGPQSGWPRKGYDKRSRKVTLKAFFIDRHEVTNAEYMTFWRQLALDGQLAHVPRTWEQREDGTYAIPAGKEDHPVVGVTFNDALAYATWAGKRLPTEDEWEAAARGPKALRFPWGDDYQPGRANDRDAGLGDTAPVGSFPDGRSPAGCLDMAGNVEEWTASTDEGDVASGPLTSNLVLLVVRGGNFNAGADGIATTFRWVYPGMSTRRAQLGFRCAMDAARKR